MKKLVIATAIVLALWFLVGVRYALSISPFYITSTTDTPPMPWVSTNSEMYVDVNLTDGQTHYITFQFQDDGTRTTHVDVINADTGLWLDAGNTFQNFAEPVYGTWECKGHLLFRFRNVQGADIRITGVFFDSTKPVLVAPSPSPTPVPSPSSTPVPCRRLPNGKCKKN